MACGLLNGLLMGVIVGHIICIGHHGIFLPLPWIKSLAKVISNDKVRGEKRRAIFIFYVLLGRCYLIMFLLSFCAVFLFTKAVRVLFLK